ncbi:MHYT domain-containing protein [Brevundimonas fluminis]|uniref:MHYT domain-containing protein n=1 Tax=Brevundimonas fluminis TaxID=2487274 RepID=UPI000F6562A9|nr:MHYT domain-containing protein [Brevundimonas fluminis]
MHAHHGVVFVLLSYAVAAFAAWTALDLFGRVRERDGGARIRWLAVAALAMGGGVWAMHFIAMLGFDPGAPVSYEPGLTALSFILAVIGTGAAFFAAARPGLGRLRLPLSAAAMGGAIAAMHYVGMAAMRTTATVGWKPPLVVLSAVIAVAASFAALWASKRETSAVWRLGAAAALGLAVVGMHYAGMAAMVLVPTGAATEGGASPLALAVGVAAVTASILFMALGASIADQKSRLLDVIEAGGVGYWELSLKDRTVRFSERGRELLGLPPGVSGYPVDEPEGLQGDDRARRDEALRRALAGEAPYDVEYFFPASGRWVQAYGSLVRTRAGRPFKLAGVVRDVTDRKRAFDELETSERRQKLLINELNHRVKNTLATVQSIAALTARRATSVEEFGAQFQARLMALSETHNLLTAQGWEQATLRDLLEKELRPYSPEQFRLQGPDVILGPAQALAMGMILHELVTNAAKHGALSVSGGSVLVAWTEADANGLNVLDWLERDGPAVTAPTRSGFGSRLISTSVRGDLDGVADMDWTPGGLRAQLTFRARGRS